MSNYNIQISYQAEEPKWDTFVSQVPGANHLQTSLWGRVKTFSGWSAARVIISEGEVIVAGVQLLIKSLPLIGSIAYVPKGPLFSSKEPETRGFVITALFNLIKKHRMAYIILQPPIDDAELSGQLLRHGFQQSKNTVAPTATVLLDLTIDIDDILARMRRGTRQQIKKSQHQGLVAREGTKSDLNTFLSLLAESGKRLKFSPESEEYYRTMWKILQPHGHVKLFVVELTENAIAALLTIPFGNTVICKRIGWSGTHAKLFPNDLLLWTAITWAKAKGYTYFDLEGINRKDAESLIHGDAHQDDIKHKPSFFKIGFGGSVILLPLAYDYIPNPALRYAYTKIFPQINSSPVLSIAYKFTRKLFTRTPTGNT